MRSPIQRSNYMQDLINSLRPDNAIRQHRSGSTMAQVMACCWTAPSHYLNQHWLVISEVQWQSPEGHLVIAQPLITKLTWKSFILKVPFKYLRSQWVNSSPPSATYMPQGTGSALVQIMACHLFSTKPLSKPFIVNWNLRNKLQWNLNLYTKPLIH